MKKNDDIRCPQKVLASKYCKREMTAWLLFFLLPFPKLKKKGASSPEISTAILVGLSACEQRLSQRNPDVGDPPCSSADMEKEQLVTSVFPKLSQWI